MADRHEDRRGLNEAEIDQTLRELEGYVSEAESEMSFAERDEVNESLHDTDSEIEDPISSDEEEVTAAIRRTRRSILESLSKY